MYHEINKEDNIRYGSKRMLMISPKRLSATLNQRRRK
jgi:hypothetical protein